MKIRLLTAILISGIGTLSAQIPAGYYDAAQGCSGQALKDALYNIIKTHTTLDYDYLYTAYQKTDNRPDNTVWDIYSDIPGGTPPYVYHHISSDQCGSYSSEGDCYNREHSFPSSWFNDAAPMRTDIFHVMPTDGWVNNRRSNYPFADVGSVSWTSQNGSKLGSCATSGYSGTVFEPIDEYKGDLARTYFYMATCYQNLIGGWAGNGTASAILAGNGGKVFKTWYITMLFAWHHADPVSAKEIARNDSIYKIQHNRNPYIDHPDWADSAWFGQSHTAIGKIAIEDAFRFFPNPAGDDGLTVTAKSPLKKITISDPKGRVIREYTPAPGQLHFGLQGILPGVYILTAESDDMIFTRLLVRF